jgi:hypothetical protein
LSGEAEYVREEETVNLRNVDAKGEVRREKASLP